MIRNFAVVGVMLLCTLPALAQKKKTRAGSKPAVVKGLVPVYRSSLGNVLSNTLPVSMMKALLDSTLISRDSAGHPHRVVSFDFGYRTSDTFYNDSTGRPNTSNLYSAFHFNSNKLDSSWHTGISKKIKPGDELFFDRIIAEDKEGIHYLSSPLHFKIQ